jgi:hypothetical protein
LDAVLRCGRHLQKAAATELETRISSRLRDRLVRDPELRSRPVQVDCEVSLYDRSRSLGRPLGRCDIRFLYSTGIQKPWPYFVLEAKRLHVTFPSGHKSLVSSYVTGRQGMRCFTEQRYAEGLLSGGMLGYVFDGEVDTAREEIAAAVKKASGKLRCEAELQIMVRNGSAVGKTAHRVPRGEFTLYHLFLAV